MLPCRPLPMTSFTLVANATGKVSLPALLQECFSNNDRGRLDSHRKHCYAYKSAALQCKRAGCRKHIAHEGALAQRREDRKTCFNVVFEKGVPRGRIKVQIGAEKQTSRLTMGAMPPANTSGRDRLASLKPNAATHPQRKHNAMSIAHPTTTLAATESVIAQKSESSTLRTHNAPHQQATTIPHIQKL